jgi:hypothetical protein
MYVQGETGMKEEKRCGLEVGSMQGLQDMYMQCMGCSAVVAALQEMFELYSSYIIQHDKGLRLDRL